MKRSPMRRLVDALMLRTLPKPQVLETPKVTVEPANNGGSSWLALLKTERIREGSSITPQEEQMLSQVAFMGEVWSPHDFKLVLESVRPARANLAKEGASDAQEQFPCAPEEFASPAARPTR
jgi:hypothetical protein